MCSHSDLESYKNLPQSDCIDTDLLQQEPAAVEGEETLTQTTEHKTMVSKAQNPQIINRHIPFALKVNKHL